MARQRLIDLIERTVSGTPQVRFPLYNAHGNSVGTLGRSGSSWSVGDERSYDAWGRVRQGGQKGAPSARHCANLGHVQDDESGPVYMRARYYEPGTGRFISQDPAMQGVNWFSYCGNNPVSRVDKSGKEFNDLSLYAIYAGGALFAAGFAMMVWGVMAAINAKTPSEYFNAIKMAALGVALSGMGATILGSLGTVPAELTIGAALSGFNAAGALGSQYFKTICTVISGATLGGKTPGRNVVAAVSIYSLLVWSYVVAIDYD